MKTTRHVASLLRTLDIVGAALRQPDPEQALREAGGHQGHAALLLALKLWFEHPDLHASGVLNEAIGSTLLKLGVPTERVARTRDTLNQYGLTKMVIVG